MVSRRVLLPALLVLGIAVALALLLGPGGSASPANLTRPDEAEHRPPPLLHGHAAPPVATGEAEAGAAAVAPPPATGTNAPRHPNECVIHGRLLTADGKPVAGHEIRIRREGGSWGGTQPTDAAGRYRHVTRETGRWRVIASVNGAGTARAGPIEVPVPGEFEMPDLVLAGDGFIAGRVTFRDGMPADRIFVGAQVNRSLDGSKADGRLPGLFHGTALTDDEGRFRITGLRPGLLHVQAPESARASRGVSAATGDENVHLVLDIHRTRIRVRDPEGRPLPDADVGMRWVDREFRPSGRSPVRKSDGCKDMWLEPGTRVIVAGHVYAHTVAEAEIFVPDTPYSRDVDLVLEPCADATGTLRILLTDERGRTWPRFAVVLLSALARSRLTREGQLEPDADGLVRNVRPGTFEMWVWPRGTEDVDDRSYHFAVRREVTIRPHHETRLELRCRIGGRVLVRERWTHPEASDDVDVYVRFERAGHETKRPLWLDPDDEDVSRLLEPGTWTLVVEGEDVQEVRRKVRVEAGRTVIEEVTLAPE